MSHRIPSCCWKHNNCEGFSGPPYKPRAQTPLEVEVEISVTVPRLTSYFFLLIYMTQLCLTLAIILSSFPSTTSHR